MLHDDVVLCRVSPDAAPAGVVNRSSRNPPGAIEYDDAVALPDGRSSATGAPA